MQQSQLVGHARRVTHAWRPLSLPQVAARSSSWTEQRTAVTGHLGAVSVAFLEFIAGPVVVSQLRRSPLTRKRSSSWRSESGL
jgi:hypothetical protein